MKNKTRNVYLPWLLLLVAGCSEGAPGGPATVTPDQEKIMLEKMKESEQKEGQAFKEATQAS
jgi:hypothetical protein